MKDAEPQPAPDRRPDPAAASGPGHRLDLTSIDRLRPALHAVRDKDAMPADVPVRHGPGRAAPADAGASAPEAVDPGGFAGTVAPGLGVHLLDYVRVLHKRRWIASTAFLVILTAAVVYTYTKRPIYQARVQLQIEDADPKIVPFSGVTENQIGWDTQVYYQTQYRILQSRSLARRTIDRARLWDHPLLTGPDLPKPQGRVAQRPPAPAASPRAPGRPQPGQPDSPAGDPRPAQGPSADLQESPQQTRVIDRFLAGLNIVPIRNSRLVDVRYYSTDPAFAARAANQLAQAYIEQHLEYRFLSTRQATDFLDQQLAEQRKQVEASETALLRYREQTAAVSLEDKQNIVVQKLTELNAAVTRAKTDRLQKEAAYNQIVAIQGDRAALDASPAIMSNGFIQQLKGQLAELQRQRASLGEKYGDKHVEMVRIRSAIEQTEAKLQGEIANVVQALRNDYEAALANERSLVWALRQQESEAMALSRKGIDYGSLQRDAATNRALYESLLQRAKETGVAGDLRVSNIRVVDAATVPLKPVVPRKGLNLLLGFFGGAIFAVGLAFFFEYLDNRVKSPEEIQGTLGLTYLGLIPALNGKGAEAGETLLHRGVPDQFAEAFRTVRTNILFSLAKKGGRSVVVTSTAPREGKTLVAGNLAIALAQAGQGVLLLDADMRKPRVHEVFGVAQAPGLSSVLAANAKASDSVKPGPVENLWLLPAGVAPPNPAELLNSPRFAEFLETLEEHFDWVIVDSPPVMAVSDASVVAHLADGLIFVVGADQTSRYAAAAALQQLKRVKAKFLGGVLNRVNLRRDSYYYSHYYKASYSNYYKSSAGEGGR